VGELAAEMAHEFKRPLATVRTALDLLQQEYVLDDRGQAVMGAVSQQLDHLAETMRDLFSLAKPVTLEAEEVGLSEALDDALFQMAGHPALAGVQVVRDYGAGNVRVPADRKRLEQAVLNLVLNAVEAMPKGGTLTLRTRGEGADLVEIEVQDTGVGIPAGELEKITLPFYSTKPSGTGLGLPLVARVVAAHGGMLLVESEPGRGTRVRVRLPARGVPVRMTEAASWQTQESWS
jgi:signal transduction histidine kinase